MREDTEFVPSFPYHTEVPKVLLFGLLGFTCSVLAPLILPFLLVYFFLGYVVYRNQVRSLRIYFSYLPQICPDHSNVPFVFFSVA